MSIISLVILLILLPVITTIFIFFINNSKLRAFLLFMFSICGTTIMAFILIIYYNNGIFVENFNFIKITDTIYFSLQIEPFTLLFASLVSLLWPLTVVYATSYMSIATTYHTDLNIKFFYIFLSLSIFATLGIAFSGNLITTFIFYEALTLLTYPLIIYNKTKEAQSAGKVYLGILIFTSMTLFFPAIILIYNYTGSVTYTLNGLFFSSNNTITCLMYLLFLFGVSKAAIMPFHGWLPKAMVAPSPVSALLHAVAVVKSGIFVLIKVTIYIFGIDYLTICVNDIMGFNAFLIIPAVTIIVSSLVNLFQNNFKRLLAYSTINQLSYILSSLLLLKSAGVIAAAICFVAHALAKIVLFFQAGTYIKATGEENISALAGIGQSSKLPIFTTIGAFSMLSILGLPFTVGFIAKFYLVKAVIITNNHWFLAILSISYVFSVIYFSRALYHFYFCEPHFNNNFLTDSIKIAGNPIMIMSLIAIIITMINVLLFFTYNNIINLVKPVILNI